MTDGVPVCLLDTDRRITEGRNAYMPSAVLFDV